MSIALIHPMVVHFPIVLLIIAVVMDIVALSIKKDLADRKGLPMTALAALLLGILTAGVAAIFGDIALDKAVSLGFPTGPLDTHETLALITIAVFSIYGLLRMIAVWRRYPLQGVTGWIATLPGVAGVILLIATAYYGGELVYHFGVNVAAALP
jgi:uncharacterized membrane protein